MTTKIFQNKNSDAIGAFASGLCIIHCIVTPFLFIAQACTSSCCAISPRWWSSIDFIFLGISLSAVFWTSKNSSILWIRFALWISWIMLCLLIINEKIELLTMPENLIYMPAITLFIIHLYNHKYCKCNNNLCCNKTD